MNYSEIILVYFLIWQISSMPIPAWVASAFFGIDLHSFSESKQFSENHFAVQSKFWAFSVFVLECLKGLAAISLVHYLPVGFNLFGIDGIVLAALLIVVSHTFPLYSEFLKSKSVGTYMGLLLGITFVPGILALVVFVLTWALLKKVSIVTYILAVLTALCLTFTNYDVQLFSLTVAIGTLGLILLNRTTTAPTF